MSHINPLLIPALRLHIRDRRTHQPSVSRHRCRMSLVFFGTSYILKCVVHKEGRKEETLYMRFDFGYWIKHKKEHVSKMKRIWFWTIFVSWCVSCSSLLLSSSSHTEHFYTEKEWCKSVCFQQRHVEIGLMK